MRAYVAVLLAVCMVFSSGCATIATGGGEDQAVRVSSLPKGADVYVNDERVGKTPMSVRLPRKDVHQVRVEKAGYQPYERELKSGLNGWMFGNIILGGLIGLGVDLLSGASTSLTPTNVSPTLVKNTTAPGSTPAISSARTARSTTPAYQASSSAQGVKGAKPVQSAKAK